MKQLKIFLHLGWGTVAISLASCLTQTNSLNQSSIQQRDTPLPIVVVDPEKVVMGQTVYVPIYSHIYRYNSQNRVLSLSATLSIRNTDSLNSIVITSVRYYDTDGQLLRQDIDHPVALKPLASTSLFVPTSDTRGGVGANFIVDWVAEKLVSEPVIEAVMISTSSSQGISFISPGKVIQQHHGTD